MRPIRVRGCLARPGRGIFLGPAGLRAGWRVAIFLLAVSAMIAVQVVIAARIQFLQRLARQAQGGGLPPAFLLVNESLLLSSVVAGTALMAWLEGRTVTSYGLNAAGKTRWLGLGVVTGFLGFAALISILVATGVNILTPSGLGFGPSMLYALEWAVVIFTIGLTEELAFRGYLFATLQSGAGFWTASLLTSAAFGALHGVNSGETSLGLFSAAAIGLLLCLAIRRTGSLWWAIGFHTAWDYTESFLFGAKDSGQNFTGHLLTLAPHGNMYLSGGKTGPEGSLLCFIAAAAAAMGAHKLARPKSA